MTMNAYTYSKTLIHKSWQWHPKHITHDTSIYIINAHLVFMVAHQKWTMVMHKHIFWYKWIYTFFSFYMCEDDIWTQMGAYLDTYGNISTLKRNKHIYKYPIVSHITFYKICPWHTIQSSMAQKVFNLHKNLQICKNSRCWVHRFSLFSRVDLKKCLTPPYWLGQWKVILMQW